MAEILGAHAQMHDDLVVLTGLRPGAEQIAALAADDAGIPYVVVLPYPDPVAGFSATDRAEFEAMAAAARGVVTLESKRPTDTAGKTAALGRRDGWLRSVSSGALVVTDSSGGSAGSSGNDQLAKFVRALGDEVWELRARRNWPDRWPGRAAPFLPPGCSGRGRCRLAGDVSPRMPR